MGDIRHWNYCMSVLPLNPYYQRDYSITSTPNYLPNNTTTITIALELPANVTAPPLADPAHAVTLRPPRVGAPIRSPSHIVDRIVKER